MSGLPTALEIYQTGVLLWTTGGPVGLLLLGLVLYLRIKNYRYGRKIGGLKKYKRARRQNEKKIKTLQQTISESDRRMARATRTYQALRQTAANYTARLYYGRRGLEINCFPPPVNAEPAALYRQQSEMLAANKVFNNCGPAPALNTLHCATGPNAILVPELIKKLALIYFNTQSNLIVHQRARAHVTPPAAQLKLSTVFENLNAQIKKYGLTLSKEYYDLKNAELTAAVSISEKGKYLAFSGANAVLYIWGAVTGSSVYKIGVSRPVGAAQSASPEDPKRAQSFVPLAIWEIRDEEAIKKQIVQGLEKYKIPAGGEDYYKLTRTELSAWLQTLTHQGSQEFQLPPSGATKPARTVKEIINEFPEQLAC